MRNLFAEVYVPALNLYMDLLIPGHITVGQAIGLMAKLIDQKEQVLLDTKALSLFDFEGRALLDGAATFDESPIPDACSLVLI